MDEKSRIQALDRSQPVLPIMPGMPERRTHDYVRNGLTALFAAFDVATGEVISFLHRRHRAAEFKKFLVRIDKEVPAHLRIHLICDRCISRRMGVTHVLIDLLFQVVSEPVPGGRARVRPPGREP